MARPRKQSDEKTLSRLRDLFWIKGYESTSIRDIEKATGLTSGSLYHQFTNKQTLFAQALRYYIHSIIEPRIVKHLTQQSNYLNGIKTFLVSSIDKLPEQYKGHGCMLVNSAAELGQHHKNIGQVIQEGLRKVEQSITSALQQAATNGEIPSTTNCAIAGKCLALLLPGLLIAARNKADINELKQAVQHIILHLPEVRSAEESTT